MPALASNLSGPAIFLLIPKTGGTSLRAILEHVYTPDVLHLPPTPATSFDAEFDALPAERKRALACIGGHIFYGLHERVGRPSRYATLVREPIERVISHWDYVRRREDAPLCAEANELGLAGFVRRRHKALDNLQVRFLSGVGYDPVTGSLHAGHLQAACRHLDGFAAVGLTERSDDSLRLFRHAFGWPDVAPRRENKSPGRPSAHEVDAETRREIAETNVLDAQLYDHARGLFEAQWATVRDVVAAATGTASPAGRLLERVRRVLHV